LAGQEHNAGLAEEIQQCSPVKTAKLDQDATLSETYKKDAFYCYKKYKAYQPMNIYWAEQGLVLHSEFRDGNVPANFGNLAVLKKSLDLVPQGVENVFLRSDTAGYQEEQLRYCDAGSLKRLIPL